jgi:hypothetical protein
VDGENPGFKTTLLSLEVPLRRSGSPFKGIQGNQGEAILLYFYRENGNILLRRSTFNRSTFKEVRECFFSCKFMLH